MPLRYVLGGDTWEGQLLVAGPAARAGYLRSSFLSAAGGLWWTFCEGGQLSYAALAVGAWAAGVWASYMFVGARALVGAIVSGEQPPPRVPSRKAPPTPLRSARLCGWRLAQCTGPRQGGRAPRLAAEHANSDAECTRRGACCSEFEVEATPLPRDECPASSLEARGAPPDATCCGGCFPWSLLARWQRAAGKHRIFFAHHAFNGTHVVGPGGGTRSECGQLTSNPWRPHARQLGCGFCAWRCCRCNALGGWRRQRA